MQGQPLSLEHQLTIDSLWRPLCLEYDLQYTEYSFANTFLFRNQHEYTFIPGDPPLIQGRFKEGPFYITPTVPPNKLKQLVEGMLQDVCFYPIPEQWLNILKKCQMKLASNRSDADYLFKTSKLQTLAGRTLSSRRNLLHQLQSKYSLQVKPLGENEVPEALELLDAWQRGSALPPDKTDYFPCREGLQYLKKLGLFGRIAYADGIVAGFTFGELLTPKTALLHIAKSLHEIKGITPFLYKDFALCLPESVEWINLEQDLGIHGLRQSKKAYDPDLLLEKWRACPF